jgi:hypothetical protein
LKNQALHDYGCLRYADGPYLSGLIKCPRKHYEILLRYFTVSAVVTCSFAAPSLSFAKSISFDMLNATPTISWQIREDIETNHKGKRTGTTIKSMMLDSEIRDGQLHYWIEMSIDSFKISKKGKRKEIGKRAIVKSLVSAELLSGDTENILSNLRAFGTESIIQNGDEYPMRMADTGGMMAGIMNTTQTEIKYQLESLGTA